MTPADDFPPNNIEELIINPLGGLPDSLIEVGKERGDILEDRPVCPRLFELWVRFDYLSDERTRKAAQTYVSETDRISDLAQVDRAIAAVRSVLDGNPSGSVVHESSDTFKKHQQKAARAKAEKERPRIEPLRKHILDAWLSGKYSSKDLCAEQEAEAIGITFSTARRYLRNSPAPDPWPAKNRK